MLRMRTSISIEFCACGPLPVLTKVKKRQWERRLYNIKPKVGIFSPCVWMWCIEKESSDSLGGMRSTPTAPSLGFGVVSIAVVKFDACIVGVLWNH